MEDFVTFEITQKLKEKGYPIKRKRNGILGLTKLEYIDELPIISQVLKWLREEKDISVEPCATPYNCWYYMIKCKGEIKVTYTNNKYKTYELAAIAGIEYVIDNLI